MTVPAPRRPSDGGGAPLLEVRDLRAGYGQLPVLHGIDLVVQPGEAVVILGANGAGKTTTLRALSGMIRSRGEIRFGGRVVSGRRPDELLRLGLAHVPQGRGTFAGLSVDDNLRAGAITRRDREVGPDLAAAYETFPALHDRRDQPAGLLSGGEQQMLALARAMLARPTLLLLDEPSLGLAPRVVQELSRRLMTLVEETGTALLLVEQNAALGLGLASRGYVLEAGVVVASGSSADLMADDVLRSAYLGG